MPMGIRRHGLPACFILLTAWLAGCSSNEPFEQPTPVPEVVSSVELDRIWRVSVGDGHDEKFLYLQPTLMGDTLYAVSADGELVSVNPENGEFLWERELDRDIMAGVGGDLDQLYLVTEDAELLALSSADGEELWQASLPNEVLAPPQSNGNMVLVQTTDGKVLAFDTATGTKRWQYDGVVPVLTLRASATPLVGADISLVSFANGQLFALANESGQPLWQYAVGQPAGRTELERLVDVTAQPVVVDSAVLVTGYQGALAAVDLRNGQEIWRREMSSLRSPAIAYGNIFVAESNGTISAVAGATRRIVWANDELAWRQPTQPIVIGDQLMLGDFEGYLHLLSLEDGRFTGQLEFDDEGLRVPMLRWQDRVLVYSNGGKLAAFELTERD